MAGNANRLNAPNARIAAMAYDASSSSASMALWRAMIADTPQIDEPIARRLVSFLTSARIRVRAGHQYEIFFTQFFLSGDDPQSPPEWCFTRSRSGNVYIAGTTATRNAPACLTFSQSPLGPD
jgi:hypothetical protein